MAQLDRMEKMERERIEPMPGLQAYFHQQLFRSQHACPAYKNTSFNATMSSSTETARKDAIRGFADAMPEHRQSIYHSPSPESDIRFGNGDKGHSTASTSPYNGSSARTSRASSLTLPSPTGERTNNEGPNISPLDVKLVYKKLTKILGGSQPEGAFDSKEKHKFDERRRRDMHKKLQGVAEDLCAPMLLRLQNSNIESLEEDLYPQLGRAMMTGNHKKHNTKTAIYLGLIIQVLDLATTCWEKDTYIKCLEREKMQLHEAFNEAGISAPAISRTSSPPSPTNKRRRSSIIAESQRTSDSVLEQSIASSHSRHSRDLAYRL